MLARLVCALYLAAATTSLTGQQPDSAAEQINHQLSLFAQRMHDKQEQPILDSYTPDAVFIDPSGKRFSTPAQRRALYDQVFTTFDSDLHFDPPTITVHGHSHHLSGTFHETLRTRATGVTQHVHGRYRFYISPFYDGHWSFTRMQWLLPITR